MSHFWRIPKSVHVGLVPLRLRRFSNSNIGGGPVSPNDLFDLVLPIVVAYAIVCCTVGWFLLIVTQLNEIAIVSRLIGRGMIQRIQKFIPSSTLLLILQFGKTQFYYMLHTTSMHTFPQSQGRWAWCLAITSQKCQKSTSANFHLSRIGPQFSFLLNTTNSNLFPDSTYLIWKSDVLYLRNDMVYNFLDCIDHLRCWRV